MIRDVPGLGPIECVRTRVNLYGRSGSGNRCGHDRRRPVRPPWKRTLPDPVVHLLKAIETTDLPMLLGRYARRSELVEAVKAVLVVMVARCDLMTWRIGRPDRKRRRKFNGLSVDYDLAPTADISESRVERAIGTLEDWGWLHWKPAPAGKRKTSRKDASGRPIVRCASQPIETVNGQRRGRAAIRVFTEEFFRFFRSFNEWKLAADKRSADARKMADVVNVPIAGLVADLVDLVGQLDPTARGRPPPS